MSRDHWETIEEFREERDELAASLYHAYRAATTQHQPIMEYIAAHHQEYARALSVPESTDGTEVVGPNGKAIGPNYLLNRWLKGEDAGPFKNEFDIQLSGDIWKMNRAARLSQSETWKQELVKNGIEEMLCIGEKYNRCLEKLESVYRQGGAYVLRNARIIGCTTTGAAMYRSERFMFNRLMILIFV